MNVNGQHYRTIWLKDDVPVIQIIDQRYLPHQFLVEDLQSVSHVAQAIRDMHVRGAGLIGATAGYGMYLAACEAESKTSDSDDFMRSVFESGEILKATRPTAVNLEWAVKRQIKAMQGVERISQKVIAAQAMAQQIADEDANFCEQIGKHGLQLLQDIYQNKPDAPVNILTHCNAGWLAFVDYGSATAPIYAAHNQGIPVHVWVDETRPRNQGARLTAWELGQHGVPHTVIVDNVGGHLMQHDMVDIVMTGADRVTYTGDVANKIGTYLKALAAKDNGVPFYVALPSSTFDWEKRDGLRDIAIEQRHNDEVKFIVGLDIEAGEVRPVLLTPADSPAANYAFDVTPSQLVTGLITERGICEATEESILSLYPQQL